jgi:glycosyltransferase involved in cell wall biosynthesis
VILATYGRGRHIGPTIESVLAQSCEDFELIVVGDGCADETERMVSWYASPRVKWLNLPENTGSQSAPNNEGIRNSRGSFIAYIGHDDVWAPNHLSSIAATLSSDPGADVVVGGCIFHGPEGSNTFNVTGLFGDAAAPLRHFFPPSSLAHRRDVTERVGEWSDASSVKAPVDSEFLLRMARAALRFVSTSRITVHKFAAGHRYLSYLRVESDEQRRMLSALARPGLVDIDTIVEESKRNQQFMTMQYVDFSNYREGELFQANRSNKGIVRPGLLPLEAPVAIYQSGEPRALDWYQLEEGAKKFRWSGPNPKPRILIPFTGGHARVSVEVSGLQPSLRIGDVGLFVEGHRVKTRIEVREERTGTPWIVADIPLGAIDHTVLMLEAPTYRPSDDGKNEDIRRLGVAVADIALEPL